MVNQLGLLSKLERALASGESPQDVMTCDGTVTDQVTGETLVRDGCYGCDGFLENFVKAALVEDFNNLKGEL